MPPLISRMHLAAASRLPDRLVVSGPLLQLPKRISFADPLLPGLIGDKRSLRVRVGRNNPVRSCVVTRSQERLREALHRRRFRILSGGRSEWFWNSQKVLILIGREQGAGVSELSLIADLDTSNISRRCDAARLKLKTDRKLAYAKAQVEKLYHANIADSQT